MMRRFLRSATWVGMAAAIAATASTTLALASGFRVNTTASMPRGVWRLHPGAVARRGSTVLACPPRTAAFALARKDGFIGPGFCPSGYEPLFKVLAAVPGDLVEVAPGGVHVNGAAIPRTAQLRQDGAGHILPRVSAGAYRVHAGEVWLLSGHNPYSFDGRYFGAVPATAIRGVLEPVLVEGGRA